MDLEQIRVVDKIELVGDPAYRTIQVREDSQIMTNGFLTHTGNYHRVALTPGSLITTPVQVVDSLPTTPDGLTDGDLYYQATDTETTFTVTTSGGSSFSQLVLGQRGLYLYNLEADAGRAWALVSTLTDVPATYDVYRRTDLSAHSTEVSNIASVCWSDTAHTAYEAFLRQS